MKKLSILLLLLVGCTLVDEILPYRVDNDLLPYLELFKHEADKRGVKVNIDRNIILVYDDFNGLVSPWGITKQSRPGLVKIRINSNVTSTSSELTELFIVFHELGHGYLNRDHREDLDENGHCVSLMGNCGGLAISVPLTENYEGMMDELFR